MLYLYISLISHYFQGDNARERGLMDMMNGVLEVKKEDILKMVMAPYLRGGLT